MTGTDPRPQGQGDFLDLLNGIASYVRHQKEEGSATAEADPDLVRRLGAPLPARPAARPAVPSTVPTEPPPAAPPPRPPGHTSQSVSSSPAAGPGEGERAARMSAIAQEVARCTKCPLHKGRRKTVPGQGALSPDVMFIGEGPGYDEDQQGLAFVGKAGQLLTKIVEAMGYTRDQVFIGNIVKCRPPENRKPLPDEMAACLPYLQEQISLIRPKVIVALGATALQGLLDVQMGITKVRGTWMEYEGVPLMPTFHPAYLLRSPAGKKDVWEDMKAVLAKLGREPPPRKR